jgi:hypothetical protein
LVVLAQKHAPVITTPEELGDAATLKLDLDGPLIRCHLGREMRGPVNGLDSRDVLVRERAQIRPRAAGSTARARVSEIGPMHERSVGRSESLILHSMELEALGGPRGAQHHVTVEQGDSLIALQAAGSDARGELGGRERAAA